MSSPGSPELSLQLTMLVDSGADETMAPLELLDAVSAEFTGEEIELLGIGGGSLIGKVAVARFDFGGMSFTGRVVGAAESNIVVLGHADFFANFRVTFDTPRGVFIVEPHHPVPERSAANVVAIPFKGAR